MFFGTLAVPCRNNLMISADRESSDQAARMRLEHCWPFSVSLKPELYIPLGGKSEKMRKNI